MTPLSRQGFSLVELLVVMALMGLAMSLVGPATVRQVEKVEAQAELKQLKDDIRRMSYLSFTRSQSQQLLFSSNQLIVMDSLSIEPSEPQTGELVGSFEYLYFDDVQRVTLNQNGYPTPEILSLRYKGEFIDINLFRLVEATE